MLSLLALSLLSGASAQVTATGPNGPNNPSAPSFAAIGSTVNQNSMARLASLNSVDDFCLFGPPTPGAQNTVGNTEAEVVPWCTQPRNGARLIPDGTIKSAHFIKTSMYVQVYGTMDGTKLNIPDGDFGGELDPHGAEGLGNPIGGNVTSNVSGKDVFYEEWMQYVSYSDFCFRVCTASSANVTAALQCEHELDIVGCSFVMAIPDLYSAAYPFTSCEGEPAAPPGLYPLANGSTSTFRQRYTGSYTASSTLAYFTVGQLVTPSAPAFYPATSNCKAYSTISNGVNTANFKVNAINTLGAGSSYSAGAPGQPTANATSASSSSRSASITASSSGSSATASASASTSSGSGAAASATTSRASGANKVEVQLVGMAMALLGVVGAGICLF